MTPSNRSLSRRRLLGAGVGLSAALTLPGTAAAADLSRRPSDRCRPLSMVTHLHSSFSEGGSYAVGGGGGSMMGQLSEAVRHGVDVIWWTDHDWRMQAYGYYDGIAFDGDGEGQDLTWTVQESGPVEGTHAFVQEPHSPDEDGGALRVTATGPEAGWGTSLLWGKGGNSFYTTNLTDTVLTIDVLAEQVGPDAQLVVEVGTSYRPATAGRPAGEYRLQYRVGTTAGRELAEPLLGVVRVAATGDWQRLTLPLLADVAAFWPDLVAEDSALARLRYGVIARDGATGQGVFDRLRFERSHTDPLVDPVRLQQELAVRLGERYPGVTQHFGTEISMVRHLNGFMADLELYPYPPQEGPPRLDGSVEAAEQVIDWYHDRGALVQYNHPPIDHAELVATRALGADLMELADYARGYDTIRERFAQFDVAARHAIFLTGTSQQDDHNSVNWEFYAHFFLTSVWAESTSAEDLLAAMASGQVWGNDLERWRDGQLDLTVTGQRAMGKVLRTRAARIPVQVSASSLPTGSFLDVVLGDCDLQGLEPSTTRVRYRAEDVVDGSVRVLLERRSGRYLRAEVLDAEEQLIGFGNPFWMLPADSTVEIPAVRRLR